ncbi:hypothetical protein A7975_00690 [Bacillus sp. FJAT-26390]|nr:hypothetical protein A7975_00690 [Bacillus sp. FJAT-26390]
MATYWRIWGGTTSIQISSLRLIIVLGVGFFFIGPKELQLIFNILHTKSDRLNNYLGKIIRR